MFTSEIEPFRTGVLNLLVLAYPQIKIVPLCVPPNQNCIPFAYPPNKKNAVWKFLYIANDFIACCFIYFGNLETVFQKEIIYERVRKNIKY